MRHWILVAFVIGGAEFLKATQFGIRETCLEFADCSDKTGENIAQLIEGT